MKMLNNLYLENNISKYIDLNRDSSLLDVERLTARESLLYNTSIKLGFQYINKDGTPLSKHLSPVGEKLIERTSNHTLTQSYLQLQLCKLILGNPTANKICRHRRIFIFRMTLRLLLELEYLDIEELAYIVFHTKSEDEFPVLLERIKNFRSISALKRTNEINAYRKTPEGNLTLVKAPSAGYYMYLCFSTGLCSRMIVTINKTKSNKLSAIKLIDKVITKKILRQFEDAEIYDFENDWFLWKEYFSNSNRIFPPFNATVKLNTKESFLITIEQKGILLSSGLISDKTFSFPVFRNEEYKMTLFDLMSSKITLTSTINFSKKNRTQLINLRTDNKIKPSSLNSVCDKILDFFSNKHDGFDKEYSFKLKTLQKVIGKNYFHSVFIGGRLEALFNKLLSLAKESKKIDAIFWFGKEDSAEYGIAKPAPGGKNGNPDIVFEIDNYQFVLELTTYRGNRGQWNSSEASSVPDHIAKFKNENPQKTTIGIFSAPDIHPQLRKNLTLNARHEKVGMIFINCIDLANLFSKTRKEIVAEFISLVKTQMNK